MPSRLIILRGVDAKIVRAEKHLETLEMEILSYLSKKPAAFPSKLNRHKRRLRIVFKLHIEPPIELSVTVGDVVHNARSALDHIWAALTNTTDSSFPVCGTPKDWDDRKTDVLRRVPTGARAIIDRLQPCSGTDDGALLGFLNSLSNRDKHKLINLTVARAVNARFALTSRGSRQTVDFAPLPAPFDPDTSIEVTDLSDEFMEGGVDVKLQGRLTVAFKDGRLAGQNARDLLCGIVAAVKVRVLPQLRPFIRA